MKRSKRIKLHVKKSRKAYSKAVEAGCSDACIDIAEKAAAALLRGDDKVATLQFDRYGKCRRECYTARLGKRYRHHG